MADAPIPPKVEAFAQRAFALVDDPNLLFASEGERNGLLFARLKAGARAWETRGPCMYRGCSRTSIAKSHTIQRSGPISDLLEDGHVLTPRFENGAPTMKAVGASTASTFPGFCSEHELIFQSFESKAIIDTDTAIQLQTFRSICRELWRKEHEAKLLRENMDLIQRRLDQTLATDAIRYGVNFNRVEVNGGVFATAQGLLKNAEGSIEALKALYDAAFPAIDRTGRFRLVGKALQITLSLPIALSGFAEFEFRGRHLLCVLGVIPQAGGTLVYMVGMPMARKAIEGYLRLSEYDLPLLDIVETWMVRGTDHWFLRPSVWEALPEARRAAILDAIIDTSKGLGATFSLSIFDDLRRAALAAPQAPNQSKDIQDYIAAQRAKLA